MKGETPRRRLVLGALIVVVLGSACSSAPTFGEWQADWQLALDGVPPIESVLNVPGDAELRAICSDTVGHLRGALPRIERAPNADIKHAAIGFIDFAEAVFFDCPIPSGEHAGFEAGYREMDNLAAIVDTLLALEGVQGREMTG